MDEDKRPAEDPSAGTGEESIESTEKVETDQELIEVSLEVTQGLLAMLGEAWSENEELRNNLRKLTQEKEPDKAQATPVAESKLEMMDGVILIDDSQLMIKRLSRIIESLGFKIIGIAENGESGAELVIRKNPKLVILDHFMSAMDGLACLRAIRMQCLNTRVIICTGEATETLSQEYAFYDISAIITKPIQLDRFTRAVQECMNYDFSLLENL